jgi:hypothetical protein
MKHYLIFGLVFLLVGCGTTGRTLPAGETLPEKEVKPVAAALNTPNIFHSQKPILCGKPEIILHGITNEAKESPVMFWQSESFGYPVALYLNQKTGTSTVLDFVDSDKICIISVGKNVKLSEEFKPIRGMKIKYLTF